jgi:hypothetical protein
MAGNSSASASRRFGNRSRPTPPPSTATASLICRYRKTFVNRPERFLAYGTSSGWYSKRSKLTDAVIEQALRGTTFLGLYATSKEGTSLWTAWDADSDEDAHRLLRLAHLLPPESTIVERSRRGIHLFRLFDPPVPWRAAQRYGIAFAAKAGCDIGLEVFPKNGTFSGIRAPMTTHPKTGRVYDWLDPETGQVLDPWAVFPLLTPTPIPGRWLEEPEPEPAPPTHTLTRALPFDQFGGTTTLVDEHRELVELASRYTTLRPTGQPGERRYTGRCMFHHPDRNRSFGIDGPWFECFAGCLAPGPSRGGLNLFKKILRERGM